MRKSKRECRIEIAKDAIKHLNLKNFKIAQGAYCLIKNLYSGLEVLEEVELQSILPKIKCNVCALGASMISLVRLYDNFKVRKDTILISRLNIINALKKYFSFYQLCLIESAFERCCYNDYYDFSFSNKAIRRAIAFGERFTNPKDRFEAIMKNIIDNDGLFKP
jgi:hypothetical protein